MCSGLDEAQPGIKIAGGNINNLRYADDTTLMTGREEDLKSLLMKVKKTGLKLNTQETKIMASSPITLGQIEGEKVSSVTDFIFLGSKTTSDSNYSHEIQRHLLFGKKAMIKPDSILKSKDIALLTKICIVKAMVFPIVMYRFKS